ncbi:MAG: hypothetical protein DRQ89_14980 [Epsilonproteobacteria bacterium]|nr:MAG: hypothetical protein DRQ89_14980 [Campylobacterota bacterium]
MTYKIKVDQKEVRLNPDLTIRELLEHLNDISCNKDDAKVAFELGMSGEGFVKVNVGQCCWDHEYSWDRLAPEEAEIPPVWPLSVRQKRKR